MSKVNFSDLLGKILLVDIKYCNSNNELIDRWQYWGTVIAASKKGISIKLKDGSTFDLPPDTSSTLKAPLGEYRLNSTGEVVVNPDYLATWTVFYPE